MLLIIFAIKSFCVYLRIILFYKNIGIFQYTMYIVSASLSSHQPQLYGRVFSLEKKRGEVRVAEKYTLTQF